ncbi:hypothetical protein GEMRC1_011132 [Eukaryota sp. GEM-RC1]
MKAKKGSWAADVLTKTMKKNLGRNQSVPKKSLRLISRLQKLRVCNNSSLAEQFLNVTEVAELKKKHFEHSPKPVFEDDKITTMYYRHSYILIDKVKYPLL